MNQISHHRRRTGLTQAQLAEQLGVSFQAVSAWESGEYAPGSAHLLALARLLNTSAEALTGDDPTGYQPQERIFDEKRMYTHLRSTAQALGLTQTLRALPAARDWHAGQFRKGRGQVPYIIHPLTLACHALSLGLRDDDLLAALLLHDVLEDCGVTADQLPVGDAARRIVELVTKHPGQPKADYYAAIAGDPLAAMVKLLDRCNNLSGMSLAFTRERMAAYLDETERYILPLIKPLRNARPEWAGACFALRYHMVSLMNAVASLL